MLKVGILTLVGGLAVAALVGCSSDDSGGGSSGTGGAGSGGGGSGGGGTGGGGSGGGGTGGGGGCDPTGSGGNDCPAYTDCVQANCNTEYETCLGAGFKTGNFAGGACEAYMDCVVPCNCDPTCAQGCTSSMTSACTTCMMNIGTCGNSACAAELQQCAGGTGGSGSGGTGGLATCDDLAACCASMSGTDHDLCQSQYDAVKSTGDIGCNSVYQSYKTSGKC